jgi:hypothetical protein
LAESKKVERVFDLDTLNFSQLGAELGFSGRQLKTTSTVTDKRFDYADDTLSNYTAPEVSSGLEQYFGQYSVIHKVYITAGKDTLKIAIDSDQDATIAPTVSPAPMAATKKMQVPA